MMPLAGAKGEQIVLLKSSSMKIQRKQNIVKLASIVLEFTHEEEYGHAAKNTKNEVESMCLHYSGINPAVNRNGRGTSDVNVGLPTN